MSTGHKKQFISGVAYTALSKYAGLVIQLGISGVLGRLLSPGEFGVVAVATVLITFFTTFSDMGLGPAIIQHKDLSQRDIENIFCFSTWTGIALGLLFFGGSGWIGDYYDSPALAGISRVLSLQLILASANIVPNALMYRDKQFRFLAVRTMAVQVGAGAVAIVMAFELPDAWKIYSLAAQPVLSAAAILAVNMTRYPMPLRPTLGIVSVRRVFKYSAWQFLFNFINYFSRNLDKLVMGKYLGMNQLGFYEKSHRLMMLPLQNITNVLTPVMHPVFSQMQNDRAKMLGNYMRVVRWLALVGFPLSAALFFCGREMLLLIFGMQWSLSVPTFQILALTVGIQIVLSSSGPVFQAAGDTRSLFISGLTSAITNVGGLFVALATFGTIESVGWAMLISFSINFIVCYVLMYRVTFRAPMGGFWRQFLSPLALTAISGAVLWGADILTREWEAASGLGAAWGMILSLGIKCFVAGILWAGYVQLTGEFDLVGNVKSIIHKR